MFNNHTWAQIQKHLKYLSQHSSGHYRIFSQPGNNLYLLKIVRDEIYIAEEKSPKNFSLLSREYFEELYNELVFSRELTHRQAKRIAKGKKWLGVLCAILALLDNVTWDKKTGALKYN